MKKPSNVIKCPNCEEEYFPDGVDREMFQDHPLSGSEDYECVKCGATFTVIQHISWGMG
jgi:hypothetical protein